MTDIQTLQDNAFKEVSDIYPLTIISDRYTGSYSGGNFLAFYMDHWNIPEEIGGGDSDEIHFWEHPDTKKLLIGKGDTPQAAAEDLLQKLNS